MVVPEAISISWLPAYNLKNCFGFILGCRIVQGSPQLFNMAEEYTLSSCPPLWNTVPIFPWCLQTSPVIVWFCMLSEFHDKQYVLTLFLEEGGRKCYYDKISLNVFLVFLLYWNSLCLRSYLKNSFFSRWDVSHRWLMNTSMFLHTIPLHVPLSKPLAGKDEVAGSLFHCQKSSNDSDSKQQGWKWY